MLANRIILLGLAVAAIAVAGEFFNRDRMYQIRVQFARLRGYDGCTCCDCADAFGFGPKPTPDGWVCRMPSTPRALDRFPGGVAGFCGSLLCIVGLSQKGIRALHPREPAHGCCAACGYDLSGLTCGICPECGTLDDQKGGGTSMMAAPHDDPTNS